MTQYDLKAESERLLKLTTEQTRTGTLVSRARKRVDAGIRELYDASGVVGKFKIRGLGEVRLDGIDAEPKPYVANADTYSSYVAERSPENVTATIEVPSAMLEDALAALDMGGIEVLMSKAVVRDAYTTKLLADLELEENPAHAEKPTTESKWIAFDTTTSEQVPGIAGRQSSPTLKVVLDKEYKAGVEEDAEQEDVVAARDLGYGVNDDQAQDDAAVAAHLDDTKAAV